MNFLFILFILLTLVAIVSFFFVRFYNKKKIAATMKHNEDYPYDWREYTTPLILLPKFLPSIFGGFAIISLFFATFFIVPTQSVGIVTNFSKPVASHGHGHHFKAPWQKVHVMDGTVQNSVYSGNDGDYSRINVRLASSVRADLDVSIRWRVRTEGAEQLFIDYRKADLDIIQQNVIDRNLREALGEAMSSYDPLNPDVLSGENESVAIQSYSEKIADAMRQKVSGQVEIIDVTIPMIHYDEDTENRISEYQAEIAKTRNAEQAKKTAEQEAEANRILSESVTDETNVSKCLDVAREKSLALLCFEGSATPVHNTN